MKTIKKFAMSLLGGGIAVAALAFTLMSAGLQQEGNVKKTDLHWYEKNQSTGEYSEVSSPEPPSGCPETPSSTICAIGFNAPQNNVTDADALGNPNVRYRP